MTAIPDKFKSFQRRDQDVVREAVKLKLLPHKSIGHPSIWIKQEGKCYYCNIKLFYPRNRGNGLHKKRQDLATVDHIIPKCLGGNGEEENLVYACSQCNQEKGSEQWIPKNN